MKKLIILVLCLSLTACASINDENSIFDSLNNYFSSSVEDNNLRFNHTSDTFTYYLPSDVFELDSNKNAIILSFNNSTIIMNLNIASIIASSGLEHAIIKDDGFFDNNKVIYSYTSKYINADDINTDFIYNLYKDSDKYLINFVSSDLNFYVTCPYNDVLNVTSRILRIARSTSIDREVIINSYSNKNTIDYDKKQINLFEYSMPSSGLLSELVDYTNYGSNKARQ